MQDFLSRRLEVGLAFRVLGEFIGELVILELVEKLFSLFPVRFAIDLQVLEIELVDLFGCEVCAEVLGVVSGVLAELLGSLDLGLEFFL